MTNNQVLNQTKPDVAARSDSTRWLATVVNGAPIVAPGYHWRRAGPDGQFPALYSAAGTDTSLPASAECYGCAVVFGGALYNGRDLQEVIGELPPAHNDAELVLAGYVRWGEDILQRLRGVFALIIWDSVRNTLICVRDPLGIHPMFTGIAATRCSSPHPSTY